MKTKLAFVGLAWLSAFLIVMTLFLVLGRQLEQLALPLRALAISGVLVILMTQLVIPTINRYLHRRKKN